MTGSGHTIGLLAGGRMGRLIAEKDWSATPLGPMDRWPETLKTMVGLMLRTRQPAYVAWGPEQVSLYNDGYIPILGAKHPEGLGAACAGPLGRDLGHAWPSQCSGSGR
jgi:hypothetical protein